MYQIGQYIALPIPLPIPLWWPFLGWIAIAFPALWSAPFKPLGGLQASDRREASASQTGRVLAHTRKRQTYGPGRLPPQTLPLDVDSVAKRQEGGQIPACGS